MITNFKDGDTIELGSGLGVRNVEDALSHATVRNGIGVFRFDGGEELIVGFTDLNQLRDSLVII